MSAYLARRFPFAVFYQVVLAVALGLTVGVLVVHVQAVLIFGALVAAFAVFLVAKKPEYGIVAYLFLISTFFDSTANIGISMPFGHIYLSDLLLLTLFVMIGLRALVEADFDIVHTPLDLPLLLFVAAAYFATFAAMRYASLTLQASLAEMRVVASYLLFFAVTNLVRSENQLRFLMRAIFFLAALVSVAMILEYVLGPAAPRILAGRIETLSTEGTNTPDVTRIIPPGDSLVLVGFFVLCVVLWLEKDKSRSPLILIAALLTGIGVLLTFKRHYWTAAIFLFAILLYLGRRRNFQSVLVGGLMVLAGLSVAYFLLTNFTGSVGPNFIDGVTTRLVSLADPSTYTDPGSSLQWRTFEDEYALPQIIAHPFLGLGLGAQYRPLVPPRDWAGFDGRTYIHNSHLWILVKTGFLGYLPLFALLVIFIYRGLRYGKFVPDSRKRLYVLGFTLAFLGMLVGSWVEPTLMEASWTPVIGAMLGITELILNRPNLATP